MIIKLLLSHQRIFYYFKHQMFIMNISVIEVIFETGGGPTLRFARTKKKGPLSPNIFCRTYKIINKFVKSNHKSFTNSTHIV